MFRRDMKLKNNNLKKSILVFLGIMLCIFGTVLLVSVFIQFSYYLVGESGEGLNTEFGKIVKIGISENEKEYDYLIYVPEKINFIRVGKIPILPTAEREIYATRPFLGLTKSSINFLTDQKYFNSYDYKLLIGDDIKIYEFDGGYYTGDRCRLKNKGNKASCNKLTSSYNYFITNTIVSLSFDIFLFSIISTLCTLAIMVIGCCVMIFGFLVFAVISYIFCGDSLPVEILFRENKKTRSQIEI